MKKRFALFTLILVLFVSICAVASASYSAYLVSPNGKKVNIRRGAGIGYSLIYQAPSGTQVTVAQKGAKWSRVTVGGLTGYVQTSYITRSKPAVKTVGNTTTTAKTYTAYIVSSNGKKINVRRGAGTGYAINGKIEPGTKVTVIKDSSSNKWSHISSGNLSGYVQNQYLSKKAPSTTGGSAAKTPSFKTFTAYITTPDGKRVNVRRGAGTGYAANGKLDYGTKVKVTGKQGNWYYVEAGNLKGYVNKNYITKKVPKSASSGTTPATTKAKTRTVKSPDGGKVNMRRGPGAGYARVAQIEAGTKVKVLSVSGSWSKVQYNGITGYIKNTYLK